MPLVRQPPGVPHEVDRGEERDDADREDATEDRGRVHPARPRVAGLAAGRHPTRRDRAGDRPHAVGHEHRRDGERGAEVAAIAGAEDGLAEGEARSPQHDAEGRDRERDEQGERDRRVGLGEAGPQDDEAEDQPDVVGLPHRCDRVVDHLAGSLAALGASGDEVPEAGPEVGAAEDGVGGDADEQHDGRGGAHPTGTSPARSCSPAGDLGWSVGHVGLVELGLGPEPAAHQAEHEDGGDAEPDVEQRRRARR